MAPILTTTEVVVTRIAAKCTFVDERGGVGIRLEPAAAIVHQMATNPTRCGVNGGPGPRNLRLCCDRLYLFSGGPPSGRAPHPLWLARLLCKGVHCGPVWPPKSLVPDEFVMDLAPAAFGGTLDPWPMPASPMSASAVR